MLNKATSPTLPKNGGKCQLDFENFKKKKVENKQINEKYSYRVAHQHHEQSLWFLRWKGVGVCPPSAAAKYNKKTRTKNKMFLVAVKIWYSYITNKINLKKTTNKQKEKQAPAKCRPGVSASRWALRRLPGLWWPGSSCPASGKRAGVISIITTAHSCLKSSSMLSYLCFFVADQSRPSLARWQIEVHRVPVDSLFEPGWSEKSSSAQWWIWTLLTKSLYTSIQCLVNKTIHYTYYNDSFQVSDEF